MKINVKILCIISFINMLHGCEVSKYNEAIINTVLIKSQVSDPIVVKNVKNFHSFASAQITFKIDKRNLKKELFLLIDEEKLNTLTPYEKEFVLLHEACHLKKHMISNLWYSFLPYLSTTSTIATTLGISIKQGKGLLPSAGISAFMAAASFITSKMITAYFLRLHEKEADEFAFMHQDNFDVARSVFEKRKTLFGKKYPTSWWNKLFEDHPDEDERIANLELLHAQ